MKTIAYFMLVLALFGVMAINIYDQRRRRAMTPEERKYEDEEIARETQIW